MTEPENFLQRWSKRKLANEDEAPPQGDERSTQAEDKNEPAAPVAQDAGSAGKEKPFDLASLPSIESIDANTDVTAFLSPEVPAELSRAALRRAWSTDPAIRDFVGLVENGWDFNDPNAMPGFGPITPAEVVRLAAHLFGEPPAPKGGTPVEAAEDPALVASEGPKPTEALAAPADAVTSQQDAASDTPDEQRNATTDVATQKTSEG
jgi:hypothetical protein